MITVPKTGAKENLDLEHLGTKQTPKTALKKKFGQEKTTKAS